MASMNLQGNISFKNNFFQKEKSKIVVSNYLKLLQCYWVLPNTVHLFVENLDDFTFYSMPVKIVYQGHNPKFYRLEGKTNVTDSYREFDWKRFKRSKILFLADKDYDDFLGKEQVTARNFFYTKFYSIENYFVNEFTFRAILEYLFTRMDDDIVEKLVTKFNIAHNLFQQKLKVLTRIILIHREKDGHLELDSFKMSEFMLIDNLEYFEKELISEYKYNKLIRDPAVNSSVKALLRKDTISEIMVKNCGGQEGLVTFSKIMRKDAQLNNCDDPHCYIRGKYAMWFLMGMINSIEKAIERIYEIEERVSDQMNPMPRKRAQIIETYIFDLLSPKINVPADVYQFLMINYKSIHEND
ncbi:DUF4435 domain-containing protein [Mucilaginibacter jinjuensis]|uniref:DUF4435 domain-containing protein n=1 Tax=Mucilaginibacter jinjuensis TaxID=1176721 RepID=A0ABY7TAE8_9SPHI|nr:DUF4435 domain-containing protein [Mucilaginibacter jinjuensis]WCT13490.1 DUF4435 domain-containing protein [Mucilaginibacter jinjuensis]